MKNKKRKECKTKRDFLLIFLVVGIFFAISFSGVVMGVGNTALKKIYGESATSTIDTIDIKSLINIINTKGVETFREIWTTSTPEEKAKFTSSFASSGAKLTPFSVTEADRNDFYMSLLKEKYKEIKSVDLGDLKNIGFDDKIENLLIKGDNGEEFKLPINKPNDPKTPLVSIKNVNGIIKISYDPQFDNKENIGKDSTRLRTLAITPGLKGSINPGGLNGGNYIDKDGKETKIGLLNGQGGELGLSMKGDALVVKIAKLNLNEADKATWTRDGAKALKNTPVLKVSNDYFYGTADPGLEEGSSFEMNPANLKEIAATNGEIAASNGKQGAEEKLVAYIRNSGTYQFGHEKGTESEYTGDKLFKGKLVIFDNNDEGKYGLRVGRDVYVGIGLLSEFDYADAFDDSDDKINGKVVINDNGVPAVVYEANANTGTRKLFLANGEGELVECSTGSVDCVGFPIVGGLARVTLRGAGLAARGAGTVIRGEGRIVSWLRDERPVRTAIGNIFANQPVRRLGGAALRSVGTVGRGAINVAGRVGQGAVRVGGGAARVAGRAGFVGARGAAGVGRLLFGR